MSTTSTTDSLVWALLLLVALLVLAPLVMMLFALPFMGAGMGWGGMAGMGTMGVWGWVGPLMALVVLAVGGYLLYGTVSGSGSDPALEELRSAYARGEMGDEEFEKRRERLRKE
jgi:putative membrane protein